MRFRVRPLPMNFPGNAVVSSGIFVVFGFCMWMASYGANEACQGMEPAS